MDFHAYSAKSNRKSIYFTISAFLVLGMLISAMSFYFFADLTTSAIVGGTIAAIVIVVLALNSTTIALALNHAKEVDHYQAPELFNIVEEMSIAAGMPMPKVYIVDDMALNAFAVGTRDKGHVAFTAGLLGALNREELQGVAAHEISHLKNGDSKLMTIVAGVSLSIGFIADFGARMLIFGGGRNNNNSGPAAVIGLVIALVAIVLAPLLGLLVQAAISREREWLADSTAVELTRNPGGLRSALEILGGSTTRPAASSTSTSHLWIAEPMAAKEKRKRKKKSAFSTHPPIEERVERLRQLENLSL